MAKFSNFFKIVTPEQTTVQVTDSQGMDGQYSSYGNYSWYQRLVQGSATRLTRYREYDVMDNDVEVSRALDIIAEEMTGKNQKTDLPLDIDIQAEDGEQLDNTMVMTLRAALRHWSTIHDWENRLFKVARNTAKYGDCFFKRNNAHKVWEYIPPQNVLAAVVDVEDVTEVVGYQIRNDMKKPKAGGNELSSLGNKEYNTEFVHAKDMVRFTLNDDMSESAPFGDSVLKAVYKAHKQKELLEDAIVIYRIQRAPERRVFYIDVGKMPPQRVKQYLETIKNEIRQKKIPSASGGKDAVDSVYNPQSMTEDFFFAQRPDGRGSRVETLPGGQGLGELSDLDYFQDKVYRGLRVPVSWMKQGQEGGMFNDGKVGVAYIEELRFALFIERLQGYVERVIDDEFKKYLRACNINVDETLYKVKLPEPMNFGKYRQAAIDSELLGTFASADGVGFLSKRFVLSRYLQLTEDEIITNEMLLREEKGIDKNGGAKDYPALYNPEADQGLSMGGGGGPMGGMGGMDMGGAMPPMDGGDAGAEGTAGGGMNGTTGTGGGAAGANPQQNQGGTPT